MLNPQQPIYFIRCKVQIIRQTRMIFKFFAIDVKLLQVFKCGPVILDIQYATELNFGIMPDFPNIAGISKNPNSWLFWTYIESGATIDIEVICDNDTVVKFLKVLGVILFIMNN